VTRTGPVEPTGSFADLAFHALAHLRVPGHTSIFDPRYVSWARGALPPEAVEPIEEDARLLQTLHGGEPRVEALHALPLLHGTIEGFLRTADRALDELEAGDVVDPTALDVLRSVDPSVVEILRADLALAAPAYARAWEERIRPALKEASRRGAAV